MVLRWLLLAALGCDGGRPMISFDATIPEDSGFDAGMIALDGGTPDAGDAGPPPPTTCMVLDDPPLVLGDDGRGIARSVVLVPGADRFVVVWGQSPMVRDEVRLRQVPTTGALAGTATLVADVPILGAVAAGATSAGWVVAWDDNALGNYEIQAARVAPDLTASQPVRLTDTALREDTPSLAVFGDRVLVGWTRDDGVGSRTSWARPLDASGNIDGAEMRVSMLAPARLTATRTDMALTWVEPLGGGTQAFLQELSAVGMPLATPHRLDAEANVADVAQVGTSLTRSAAVFGVRIAGVRAEVRFQSLDENGQRDHVERVITPSPDTGTGPSVAPLSGGWAVAYRTAEAAPRIRIALVDFLGGLVSTIDAADVAAQGGPVSIAVAGDGRMIIAWVDVVSRRGTVYAARIECGG